MITNADIKLIRSLREKKFREQHALFVVEGEKMLSEAQSSDYEIIRVIRIEEIGQEAMSRICTSSSAPPVIALVRIKDSNSSCSEEITLDKGLCLALDSVRDPGNMGTIIRIADWFGVRTLYASEDSVEFYNPKVIQSSMGSIFRVNCLNADIPSLCKSAISSGMEVYGTFLDGENIYNASLQAEGLIVMGNESNGISKSVESLVSKKLHIPSFGGNGAESLNVAVATAVTLSEFRRR